jgi:hypothetical protein
MEMKDNKHKSMLSTWRKFFGIEHDQNVKTKEQQWDLNERRANQGKCAKIDCLREIWCVAKKIEVVSIVIWKVGEEFGTINYTSYKIRS